VRGRGRFVDATARLGAVREGGGTRKSGRYTLGV
jgi:hypothetical protein